jgi:hypothetical protein
MKERRRVVTSQQRGECDLPIGGVAQVFAANDVSDVLHRVIDADSPLICPVAETIANQHIAADTLVQAHTPADAINEWQPAIPAPPGVNRRIELFARAVAAKHEAASNQRRQRRAIDAISIALAAVTTSGAKSVSRKNVGTKSEPVQVVEERRLEFAPATLAIVIFDPQQDLATARASHAPHIDGVDDVT